MTDSEAEERRGGGQEDGGRTSGSSPRPWSGNAHQKAAWQRWGCCTAAVWAAAVDCLMGCSNRASCHPRLIARSKAALPSNQRHDRTQSQLCVVHQAVQRR